jgi:hypothetical protein
MRYVPAIQFKKGGGWRATAFEAAELPARLDAYSVETADSLTRAVACLAVRSRERAKLIAREAMDWRFDLQPGDLKYWMVAVTLKRPDGCPKPQGVVVCAANALAALGAASLFGPARLLSQRGYRKPETAAKFLEGRR